MLAWIYDASEEFYLKKNLQMVNDKVHLIKQIRGDADNVINCVYNI